MKFRKFLLASIAGAGAASLPGVAAAQEAPAQTAQTFSDIVVSAQKRDENLQDVPVAVSAFTAEFRDATGIISTQDQMNFTPGVTYSATADRVAIRGIGRQTNQIGTDPGVAIYQDGFYVPQLTGVGGSTLGQERTEVLRGPQGTLYGRNSVGGAVNVISRRPSDDFEGEVRLGLNDYERVTLQGRLAGPLSDTFGASFRIQSIDQEKGYYENIAGGTDEGGVVDSVQAEVQLDWDVTERLNGWVRWQFDEYNNNDRADNLVSPYDSRWSLGNIPTPTYGLDPLSNPGVSDPRKINTNRPSEQTLDNSHLFITQWTYEFDNIDFKYIGGYQQYDFTASIDGDRASRVGFQHPVNFNWSSSSLGEGAGTGGPGSVNPAPEDFDSDLNTPGIQQVFIDVLGDIQTGSYENKDAWSHEINLSSSHDGPLQWLIGAYYSQEKTAQGFNISLPGQAEMLTPYGVAFTPALIETVAGGIFVNSVAGALELFGIPFDAPANPLYDGYRYITDLEQTSAAVFAQLDYQFNDEWSGTFGIRYTRDEKEGNESQRIPAWFPIGVPAGETIFLDINGDGVPETPFLLTDPIVANFAYDITLLGSCPTDPDGCSDGTGLNGAAVRSLEDSWNSTTGTLGLQWTPSEDTLVYATYSRGFKAGGFNLGTFSPVQTDEETVDAFEIGFKQNWDRLQLNGAVFMNMYEGMQVPNQVVPTPGISLPSLINLDEAEIRGVELEAVWRPTDNLTLLGNYSFLDTEITDACCVVDAANPRGALYNPNVVAIDDDDNALQRLDGNEVPFSPEHKIALNATYTFFMESGELSFSVTENIRTGSYYTVFNTPDYEMPGYDTTDFRVRWLDANDRFSIIGTVSNAFDEEAVQSFTTTSPATSRQQTIGLQPPRIYAVEFQYRF